MIPLGGDPWTITTSTDCSVAFTVWALLRDGLRAGAFISHPDGDRRLRNAGLTGARWLAWFEDVVRAASEEEPGDTQERDTVFISEPPTRDELKRHAASELARTAAGKFDGNPLLKGRLAELWNEHSTISRDRAGRDFARHMARYQAMSEAERDELALRSRRFWDELQIYRPLPLLHIYLVEYPVSVVTVIHPASLVLGLVNPDADTLDEYSTLVFTGVQLLKQAS